MSVTPSGATPSREEAAELERLGNVIVDEIAEATTLGKVSLKDVVFPQILAAWDTGFTGVGGKSHAMPQGLAEHYGGYCCDCAEPQIIMKITNNFGWCRACGWLCDRIYGKARWYRPEGVGAEG